MITQTAVTNPIQGLSTVAIVPFYNLSNERTVDGRLFAEIYQSELQKIPGFQVLPVGIAETAIVQNRLDMNRPDDVIQLAQMLHVDAIVVGAVTNYNPYYPPQLGMQVSWYSPYRWEFFPGIPNDIYARRRFKNGDRELDCENPEHIGEEAGWERVKRLFRRADWGVQHSIDEIRAQSADGDDPSQHLILTQSLKLGQSSILTNEERYLPPQSRSSSFYSSSESGSPTVKAALAKLQNEQQVSARQSLAQNVELTPQERLRQRRQVLLGQPMQSPLQYPVLTQGNNFPAGNWSLSQGQGYRVLNSGYSVSGPSSPGYQLQLIADESLTAAPSFPTIFAQAAPQDPNSYADSPLALDDESWFRDEPQPENGQVPNPAGERGYFPAFDNNRPDMNVRPDTQIPVPPAPTEPTSAPDRSNQNRDYPVQSLPSLDPVLEFVPDDEPLNSGNNDLETPSMSPQIAPEPPSPDSLNSRDGQQPVPAELQPPQRFVPRQGRTTDDEELTPEEDQIPPEISPYEPLMSYTRIFDGADADLQAALRDYLELRGDDRGGEWQGYLQRSEDFIRFTTHRMIVEMLTLHGGEGKQRIILTRRKYK